VYGKIDIVADIRDQRTESDGSANEGNLAPYRYEYSIRNA
jgi:hypothetical protein